MIKFFDKKSGLYMDLLWIEVNREIDRGMMSFNIGIYRNQYQVDPLPLKSIVKMGIKISYLDSFLELSRDWGTDSREIFISGKVDMKFIGARKKWHNYNDERIEFEFYCESHEVGSNFPELIQFNRDKKIDQILN
jgi:hypothetical protein